MSFSIPAGGTAEETVAQLRKHTAAPGSFEAKLRRLLADAIEAEEPYHRKGFRWAYHISLHGHHQAAGETGSAPIALAGTVLAQQVPDTSPAVQATAGDQAAGH